MKGDLTLKILELIKAGAEDVLKDLNEFHREHYLPLVSLHAGLRKLQRKEYEQMSREAEKFQQRQYQLLMAKLKKDGVITFQSNRFLLTKSGEEKLFDLKFRKFIDEVKKGDLKLEKSSRLIIVVFDIPELHKWAREWLRQILKDLGYLMLQRSVWIGKTKLPQEVIDELDRQAMLHHIHIFIVEAGGTLEKDFIVKMLDQL